MMKPLYDLDLSNREPRVSTGKLTAEDHRRQNERYERGSHYDCVIVGSGIAGLTVGSLLTKAGRSVCILEAHDVPGGYAHTFEWGGYWFNSQLHYVWGCGNGEIIDAYLKKAGLRDAVSFENYDPTGYDHLRLPDGRVFRIPNGFDNLAARIEEMLPGEGAKAAAFLDVLDRFHRESNHVPIREPFWKERALARILRIPTMFRYRNYTLDDGFEAFRFAPETRTVFSAISGTFLAPPRDLSLIAYGGVLSGFNTGAYYPTRHFKHMVDSIVEGITGHGNCSLFLETPVTKFHVEGGRITGVVARDGKKFTADQYICNMDPQAAIAMIGPEHFSRRIRQKATYDYSHTSVMLYLGLGGLDLRKHGFGNFNRWHLEQWDMNRCWDELMAGNYERPWLFMSTPTLHTPEGGVTPPGGQIMEVLTLGNFDAFAEARRRSRKEYDQMKHRVAGRLLDIVEQHYVPDLRRHIVKFAYGSPTTNEDFVLAPRGNAYGSHMTPSNMGLDRLRSTSGIPNLHWCSASSGHAGVFGTVRAGVVLYMNLTGDWFWNPEDTPLDDVLIGQLRA